jgi:hypothetical protein
MLRTRTLRLSRVLTLAGGALWVAGASALQPQQAPEVLALIAAAGQALEEHYAVARTLTAEERVVLQPLTRDLRDDGRERRLDYRMRTAWEPRADGGVPAPIVHRELRLVDGLQPRGVYEDGCLKPESPEPLSFLLPGERDAYRFHLPASRREPLAAGTITIDYEPLRPGPPALEWIGDCGSLDLPGLVRGRLTLDVATSTVRRLEQTLTGPVTVPVPLDQRRDGMGSSIRVERLEAVLEYAPVRFTEPDEVLILPVRTSRVTVVRTPETRALRVTQRLSGYRRFSTDARVLPAR